MINANGIMIGCFVQYNDGGYFKVTGIHEFGLDVEDEIETTYMEFDNFSPIHITEEILVKAGFKKHSTNPYWFRNKQICISLAGTIELISWDMQIFKVDTKAIHLHQIQLLFFSLTGQHLNIEL